MDIDKFCVICYNDIVGDIMATNEGKKFEEDIKKSIPDDVYCYRIKDPAQSFGGGGQFTRFSPKNECDFFFYKKPVLIAAELKSNQGTSISFAKNKGEKGEIKYDQIQFLFSAQRYGIKCGLLLNYRKTDTTYWIDISDFMLFLDNTQKKSVNESDLKQYNAIVVPSTKKRTRNSYDLSFLWEE